MQWLCLCQRHNPDEETPDIKGHIKSVVKTLCGSGTVKIDDAVNAIPYFDADYVRQTLNMGKEYCSAGGEEVLLIEALEVEEEEKRAICDIIDKGIAENGNISNGDILDGAMQKCSELFERYPFLTRRNAARAVFAAMFGSKYSFNKAMVSSLDDAVKGARLFCTVGKGECAFYIAGCASVCKNAQYPKPSYGLRF